MKSLHSMRSTDRSKLPWILIAILLQSKEHIGSFPVILWSMDNTRGLNNLKSQNKPA